MADGGFYVIDDLLPQPSWPPDHQAGVDRLIARLTTRPGWRTYQADVGSGIMLCVRPGAT